MAIYKPWEEAWNKSLLHDPQKKLILPTSWALISDFQNSEDKFLIFKSPNQGYVTVATLAN